MPEESLFLTKSTGSVPHTGGKRMSVESEYYRTLLRWLEAGAPPDDAGRAADGGTGDDATREKCTVHARGQRDRLDGCCSQSDDRRLGSTIIHRGRAERNARNERTGAAR